MWYVVLHWVIYCPKYKHMTRYCKNSDNSNSKYRLHIEYTVESKFDTRYDKRVLGTGTTCCPCNQTTSQLDWICKTRVKNDGICGQ